MQQGDSLSPYLFIIYAEGFSSMLINAEASNGIWGLRVARKTRSMSHLFFVDDSLLFFRLWRLIATLLKGFCMLMRGLQDR